MTLPPDFTAQTRPLMGEERFKAFTRALEEEPPVSIRINPFKINLDADAPAAGAQRVPWCQEGWYLDHRPLFTFDPLLHAGGYYVQEASSMMVSHVVRQLINTPVIALDLCAAPGGKSTAVRTSLPEGSLLISNEPIKLRAQILAENVEKFGHPDMMVANNYPRDYRKAGITFDLIVADVPCSGEGMFRKDEGAIEEWSLKNVEQCWKLQRSIIEDIWPTLRPGGLLIYSTCTYNSKEDEDNVAWIVNELGATVLQIPTASDWHITPALAGPYPAMRFIPGQTRGEGLFMAVLRKDGESENAWNQLQSSAPKDRKKARKNKAANTKQQSVAIDPSAWLEGDYTLASLHDECWAIPQQWFPLYERATSALRLLHAGVIIGTSKGRELIPHQCLAMSTRLRPNAFPRVSISYPLAVSYLRKEAIVLPADAPRGIVLIEFEGHPLGFVKNIGNRANNLYPAEWKIKSTHVPEAYDKVIDI